MPPDSRKDTQRKKPSRLCNPYSDYTDRTLQLVNGGCPLILVYKATCFKWLQNGDSSRSPVCGWFTCIELASEGPEKESTLDYPQNPRTQKEIQRPLGITSPFGKLLFNSPQPVGKTMFTLPLEGTPWQPPRGTTGLSSGGFSIEGTPKGAPLRKWTRKGASSFSAQRVERGVSKGLSTNTATQQSK